jgi:hypothetical protein
VWQLGELHRDLGADRILVERRSRLGKNRAEQRDEIFLIHGALSLAPES